MIRIRFDLLGCHSRRAQRARLGIQSKTSFLGVALDSRSGLRPAGNDTPRANGSAEIRIKTHRVFDLSWRKGFAAALLALAVAPAAQAGGEPYGVWLRPEGGQQFSFYDCGGLLCAKLISVRNAEEQHAIGTVILRGASRNGPKEWRGELYNTKDGNVYDGIITVKSANELTLKGCLWGVICKGETWRRTGGAKAQD